MTLVNHNRLLREVDGCIGVKTGYTKVCGRCLVSAANQNGLTLIAVTLDAPSDWQDHAAMLDWGFGEYECFCPTPEAVTLPVVGGVATTVTLQPDNILALTLPRAHEKITCTVEAPRFLFAGFGAGEEVGRLVYRMDGKVIGTVSLKTASGVEKSRLHRTFFQKLQDIFIK